MTDAIARPRGFYAAYLIAFTSAAPSPSRTRLITSKADAQAQSDNCYRMHGPGARRKGAPETIKPIATAPTYLVIRGWWDRALPFPAKPKPGADA